MSTETTESTATAGLPLRGSREIQGDIVAGFRKDHMQLLFLRFEDAAQARTWLKKLRTRISTTREVAAFNQEFSEARRRSGGDDPKSLNATWRNVSFTHAGLTLLAGKDPLPLPSQQPSEDPGEHSTRLAFVQGPSKRAHSLGDETGGGSDPKGWLFGYHEGPAIHAVLTVAADMPADIRNALSEERQQAAAHRIVIVYEQDGATLEGKRRGKEHFGFKDGVSEPAVRGFDTPDPQHPQWEKGHPGTRLIPAGEFVIGETPATEHVPELPAWMKNGSFHVVRRLEQDVPSWWAQIAHQLKELREKNGSLVPPEATVEWLAARVVGRWRSGTPVMKCPFADPPSDAESWKDNHISYADDLGGEVTPLWSHLRKTSPRDGLKFRSPDPGTVPEEGELDGRRIMRRGIPYGQPFDPAGGPANGPDAPRGLLFVSYQSDLVRQFEFIQRSWINADDFPMRDPQVGKDAMIGQDTKVKFNGQLLSFHQFVHTKGAVYAFAPSMSALAALAEGKLPEGTPATGTVTAPFTLRPDGTSGSGSGSGYGGSAGSSSSDSLQAGRFRLVLRADAGLVILDDQQKVRWSSGKPNRPAARATFEENGNFVVYDKDNEIIWESGTDGSQGAALTLKPNGELVITPRGSQEPVWRTGVPK
jgi:Dyp-type peroxidase family